MHDDEATVTMSVQELSVFLSPVTALGGVALGAWLTSRREAAKESREHKANIELFLAVLRTMEARCRLLERGEGFKPVDGFLAFERVPEVGYRADVVAALSHTEKHGRPPVVKEALSDLGEFQLALNAARYCLDKASDYLQAGVTASQLREQKLQEAVRAARHMRELSEQMRRRLGDNSSVASPVILNDDAQEPD